MSLKTLNVCICFGMILLFQDTTFGIHQTLIASKGETVILQSSQRVNVYRYGQDAQFALGSTVQARINYKCSVTFPTYRRWVTVTTNSQRYGSYYCYIFNVSFYLWSITEDHSNEYTWKYENVLVESWKVYVIDTRNKIDTVEAGTSINVFDFPHMREDIVRRMDVREEYFLDDLNVTRSHVYIDGSVPDRNITYKLIDNTGNATQWNFLLNVTSISDLLFTPPAPYYALNTNSTVPNVSCQTNCSPQCEIVWKKSGMLVSDTETLSLGKATSDTAGEYICTATNTATGREMSRTLYITVSENWDVVFEPVKSTYFLKEHDIIPAVRCTSECYPRCQTYWSKNGVTISNTSTLALGNAEMNEQGEYTCTVRNRVTARQLTRSLHIFVQEIWEIEFRPKKTTYFLNADQNISNTRCISSCSTHCKMSWKKDGQLISTAPTLSLGKAETYKAGEYICEVTNYETGKTLSRSLQIIVQETWHIRFEPEETTHYLNAGVDIPDINCTSDCSSSCTVSWTRNGQAISNTSTLSLGIANTEKAGEYVCELSSDRTGKTWSRSLYMFVQDERRVQRLEWFVIILSGVMGVTIIAVIAALIFIGRKRISGAIQEARPAITSARKRISSFIPRSKPIRKTGEKTKEQKPLKVYDNQELYMNEEPDYIYMVEENPGYFSNKPSVGQPEEVYEIIS